MGEDGDPVYHPSPRTVRATRPALKIRSAYLGYILRIGELEREYFILQNTDQWAERITMNDIYAHKDGVGNDRLRLRRSGRGVVIIRLIQRRRK